MSLIAGLGLKVTVERIDLQEELWDGYDQIMLYEILKESIKVGIDY